MPHSSTKAQHIVASEADGEQMGFPWVKRFSFGLGVVAVLAWTAGLLDQNTFVYWLLIAFSWLFAAETCYRFAGKGLEYVTLFIVLLSGAVVAYIISFTEDAQTRSFGINLLAGLITYGVAILTICGTWSTSVPRRGRLAVMVTAFHYYMLMFAATEVSDMYFFHPFHIYQNREMTRNCYNWLESVGLVDGDENGQMPERDYTASGMGLEYEISAPYLKNVNVENKTAIPSSWCATKSSCNWLEEKFYQWRSMVALQPSDKLIDMGVGRGVWMNYVRQEFNVTKVQGVTISREQVETIKRTRPELFDHNDNAVIIGDITRPPRKELIGQFDVVTILGSTEHFCWPKALGDPHCIVQFKDFFTNMKAYLKTRQDNLKETGKHNDDESGRVDQQRPPRILYHTLMQIDDVSLLSLPMIRAAYIVSRTYGGNYLRLRQFLDVFEEVGLKVTKLYDTTNNYYYASVADPKHFGAFEQHWEHWQELFSYPARDGRTGWNYGFIFRWVCTQISFAFYDPYWLHRWLYLAGHMWMMQWNEADGVNPMTHSQVTKSYTRSYDMVLEPVDF